MSNPIAYLEYKHNEVTLDHAIEWMKETYRIKDETLTNGKVEDSETLSFVKAEMKDFHYTEYLADEVSAEDAKAQFIKMGFGLIDESTITTGCCKTLENIWFIKAEWKKE
jgi:hypothetical protein